MRTRQCAKCGAFWTNNANPMLTIVNRICPTCLGNLPVVAIGSSGIPVVLERSA
jgi:hypothetical protein